jgi:hypothetical protein
MNRVFSFVQGSAAKIRLLAEVGKRVRGKGKRNKKTFPLFPPLAKVTFARGLLLELV